MKQLWKRNAVVGAVLVLVCAAIFLNGRYAGKVEESGKVLGQATEVSAPAPEAPEEPEETAEPAEEVSEALPSDYFATARLTRQQARDNALSLLRQAGESEETDEKVAAEVAEGIEALASYTMSEAQIENMVTAKG